MFVLPFSSISLEDIMPSLQEKSVYQSPERKLVQFFATRRNTWKATTREAKRVLKRLKQRVRCLEASRARGQDTAKGLEAA